jgi:hypothetical protein
MALPPVPRDASCLISFVIRDAIIRIRFVTTRIRMIFFDDLRFVIHLALRR